MTKAEENISDYGKMATNPVTERDLAYRLLMLERSLDAYWQLHAEEMEELKRRMAELKSQMLAAWQTPQPNIGREVDYGVIAAAKESE